LIGALARTVFPAALPPEYDSSEGYWLTCLSSIALIVRGMCGKANSRLKWQKRVNHVRYRAAQGCCAPIPDKRPNGAMWAGVRSSSSTLVITICQIFLSDREDRSRFNVDIANNAGAPGNIREFGG
jgi:hypothetical protein